VPSPRSAWTATRRWLALLIPLADVALVLTGVLDVRTGVLVGLFLELLLAVVVVAEFRAYRRAYRAARAEGRARAEAAGLGFRAVWPPVVITLAAAEIGLWRALWWAVCRRRDVAPHETAISYSDRFTVMLWAVCCLGGLELAVVHVLTARWPVARWALFVLGVYALVWFVSFGLSLRQRPHVLGADGLVLRFGWFRELRVPLQGLAAVRTGAVTGHRRNLVLDGSDLTMSVMGDTNTELRFDPPVEAELAGAGRELSRIAFWADDPRRVAALLRARAVSPRA
jgi:hypothetical protein